MNRHELNFPEPAGAVQAAHMSTTDHIGGLGDFIPDGAGLNPVKRHADECAKLAKYFRLDHESHALGVAIREYSEDERDIGDKIKRLQGERDKAAKYTKHQASDEMLAQIAHIDADIEELRIERAVISELIAQKQALVDPLRRLLGPLRNLLRETGIYSNARSADET